MSDEVLIILEGPDGSGKTALARRIADQIERRYPGEDVQIMHRGAPASHPLNEYEEPLFHYRPGTGRHVICDRWHLGEWIYPEVFNRPTEADLAVRRHIDLFLESRGALLVFTRPPLTTIKDNVETRGDDLVRVDQLQLIMTRYLSVMPEQRLPLYIYDYTVNPDVAHDIVSHASHIEDHASNLNSFVTYVGGHQPKFLIFGDVRHAVRNNVANTSPMLTIQYGPAFGPYKSTSGHYLLTHLSAAVVADCGIANACDVDDPYILWKTLDEPLVVALGQNAVRCLSRYGIPFGSAPHPQFIRRFYNSFGSEYRRAIEDALRSGSNMTDWRPKPE